jgi:NAD(P)-dependent dehydrogenase (short-subunit alcohol dehydrogenase family)
MSRGTAHDLSERSTEGASTTTQWRSFGFNVPKNWRSMDLGIRGKVAVVTAASKGIGMAVTQALADEGAHVVAGARSTSSLQGLSGVTAVRIDLADSSGPDQLIQRAIDEYGYVDVLVNNMGGLKLRLDGFLATTDDDFVWALRMNFFPALRACRAALPSMLERRSGSIVNVTSINATFQPDGGTVDYGAAKAALLNLTKSLAQEYGPFGVTVNSVAPGPVATDLWLGEDGIAETVARRRAMDPEAAVVAILAGMGGAATGKLSSPEDVAYLIVLLASSRASNITGQNLVVDGGLVKTI